MVMENEKRRCISTEELEKHNKASDLWISIQGKVYDVTEWLKDHPGGELPLLNLAGQDATDAFIAFHHGISWKQLDRFFIGHYSDYRVSEVSKDYQKLVAEFVKMGLFGKKGHGVFFSLCFMFCLFVTAVLGVVATRNVWIHLLSGGLMGFLWIQSGWVGHDAGHYQIMTNRRFNRLAQLITGNCLTGISIAWWKLTHNAHHISCNNLNFDPDLQHMPMFVVSSHFFKSLTSNFYERKMNFNAVTRFLVSYQHWTFYPVMSVARINLFVQSLVLLLLSKRKVPDRWQEIVGVLVFWTWYPFLVSFLPNWEERFMFVFASFLVTGLQHVQFCLNHFSSNVYIGHPKGNDWFEKQTMGSLDITCSPWMDWLHGGLQFQVEHHLFPRLPRCHLRRISPVVKELCKKHNLSYSSASFIEANCRTLATLRTAALQARDLGNPVPKNLVWEAVNTHG
ncbi:LOW QUALITY PROTEIN: delta(8)-fatty-acid desaturase-like [Dioscorea cayenensis subsp. rotundata]|uniref:LOW QUALITY PROTEIN: delta(8)-fatty-acid desaturase-like n=1 Tax=Dioscorea cayennensis subsp. rotundata TaxID=55577 RepID=A0AB40B1K5_DIOCR|nr:LOW QUALITY PROTEIN: delta(8)-fatty-acid desaturase-like [Dioscorea cayenensis subsp. rotundata]